jgi:phosphatidylserine/phosphatidylglycerophosphate/cardiolipin synthase-like enzyme
VIVDDMRALVTSANFAEAAMDRNIEAGVIVEDAVFASRLRAQFDALERSEQIRSVPGLQALTSRPGQISAREKP